MRRTAQLHRRIRWAGVPLLALLALLSWGCQAESRQPLSIYAASSLTDAFRALEAGFEARHPGVDVQLNFAGSQVLRLQIEQGANADLFASANREHMQALLKAGHVEHIVEFAHNTLVVIAGPETSPRLDRFEQLSQLSRIVIGTAEVPIGRYTRICLKRAEARFGKAFGEHFQAHVVSEESNVRLVRTKVELGEADAAIVYQSDAHRRPGLHVVPVPQDLQENIHYPIGQLVESKQTDLATQFSDYLRGSEGRAILEAHGFITESR